MNTYNNSEHNAPDQRTQTEQHLSKADAAFDPIAYMTQPRLLTISLGLTRIRRLMHLLGNPQQQLRFVHIAGTNGKGSTAAYIHSILCSAGYKTGLFTSPYIINFEERIRINDASIPLNVLHDIGLRVRDAALRVQQECNEHPTEFELITAAALLYFAQERCDIVVLEVGLGGRLDSTNVISTPDVAVITRIGLDHMALLGSTCEEIAHEKAGIIKDGGHVVAWNDENASVNKVFQDACRTHHATLIMPSFEQVQCLGITELSVAHKEEAPAPAHDAAPASDPAPASAPTAAPVPEPVPSVPYENVMQRFSYQGEQYKTHLLGSYQPYNAVLAIEAARVLRSRGFTIPQTALHEGIASTRWLGRFDVRSTCNDWRCVVCDGGHNPQGARALAQSIDRAFPHTKCVFVMSVLADKNYEAMIDALLDYACLWVCVTPPSSRALSAHDACACVSRKAHERNATFSVCEARSYDDAITIIQNSAASQGVPVIFFGSLYALKDTYNSLCSSGVLPSTPWGVSKK